MLLSSTRKDWLGNVRGDVLAGIVVALALIPEAIAFSIIAGVDPQVGLYSAFCIPLIMAFFGGRPAMISSSTGAMALLMVTLVKDHGLQYLLAASVLTGVFQLIAGYLPAAWLERYAGQENPFAIPVAAIIGVPLYIRAEAVIPLAAALMAKGVGAGTVLALIIGSAGASLTEVILLRALFTFRLLAAFVLVIITMAIVTGYTTYFFI
ncbi:SulP family inorganic anion transporter [Enterobacter asburiae]